MKMNVFMMVLACLYLTSFVCCQDLFYLNPSGPTERASVGVVALDETTMTASLRQHYEVKAPAENSQCHGLLVTDNSIYIGFSNGYDISGPPYFLISIDRQTGLVNQSTTPFLPAQPRRFYEAANGQLVVAYPSEEYGFEELAFVDVDSERVSLIGRFRFDTSVTSYGSFSVNQFAPIDPQRDVFYFTNNTLTNLAGAQYLVQSTPSFAPTWAPVSLGGGQWHTLVKYLDLRTSYGFAQLGRGTASGVATVTTEGGRQRNSFLPVLAGTAASAKVYTQLFESSSFFNGPLPYLASYSVETQQSKTFNLADDVVYLRSWGMNLFWHYNSK